MYLDLQGEVGADGVQQQFGGFLPAHQHQFQVHVPFDQQAFGHQTDTCHPAQHRRAVRPEGRWMTASVRVSHSHTEDLQHEYSLRAAPQLSVQRTDDCISKCTNN